MYPGIGCTTPFVAALFDTWLQKRATTDREILDRSRNGTRLERLLFEHDAEQLGGRDSPPPHSRRNLAKGSPPRPSRKKVNEAPGGRDVASGQPRFRSLLNSLLDVSGCHLIAKPRARLYIAAFTLHDGTDTNFKWLSPTANPSSPFENVGMQDMGGLPRILAEREEEMVDGLSCLLIREQFLVGRK